MRALGCTEMQYRLAAWAEGRCGGGGGAGGARDDALAGARPRARHHGSGGGDHRAGGTVRLGAGRRDRARQHCRATSGSHHGAERARLIPLNVQPAGARRRHRGLLRAADRAAARGRDDVPIAGGDRCSTPSTGVGSPGVRRRPRRAAAVAGLGRAAWLGRATTQFLAGYGAAQAVPAAVTFAAYLGALCARNQTAIPAFRPWSMVPPSILLLIGCLPSWGAVRGRPGIQSAQLGSIPRCRNDSSQAKSGLRQGHSANAKSTRDASSLSRAVARRDRQSVRYLRGRPPNFKTSGWR